MELWLLGNNFILNLKNVIVPEGNAAFQGLDHTERVAHLIEIPTASPHANPGLEPDCCLLLNDVYPQQGQPPFKKLPVQYVPPPALNHPGIEGSSQQSLPHQESAPQGLDLTGCLGSFSAALFWTLALTKQRTGCSVGGDTGEMDRVFVSTSVLSMAVVISTAMAHLLSHSGLLCKVRYVYAVVFTGDPGKRLSDPEDLMSSS